MNGESATTAGANTTLRALLEEAQMSNAGLTRAVVSAAAREGKHLATSDKTGKVLLSGVAQATRLAGFMSADTGRDALRTATDVSSTMITQRLRTLHRQIQPLQAGSPHLRELDERLTTYFTRNARQN